jgi:uncharacterized membrane protein YeiH
VALDPRLFLIPDALGLALYTVVGTKVSLALNAPWLVASFMGVITGVVGGILRDVLCNEEPLVFQGPLYATAALLGSLGYLLLIRLGVDGVTAALLSGAGIFLLRLVAIRWQIVLPRFTTRP